jgi:TolB protein
MADCGDRFQASAAAVAASTRVDYDPPMKNGGLAAMACGAIAAGAALLSASPVPAEPQPTTSGARCPADGRIAFVRDFPATGRNDIYTIRPNGNGLRQVTNSGSAWAPSWSPDGEWIAFESHVDGDGEIYLVRPDGSDLVNITNNTEDDGTPAWSPNGRWIAFASARDDPESILYEICKMRPDGSDTTRLTNNARNDHSPTWSPGGGRIAFSTVTNTDHVFVMRADGSGARVLARRLVATGADWAPKGERIAFQADHFDAAADLHTIRADGSRHRRLTRTPGVNEQSPTWSTSGTRIAFSKSWNLAVMRSDGSRQRVIHSGPGDVYTPEWGPPRC